MLKFLAKTAEKYAKATNTACFAVLVFHQPKMPSCMIKKETYLDGLITTHLLGSSPSLSVFIPL